VRDRTGLLNFYRGLSKYSRTSTLDVHLGETYTPPLRARFAGTKWSLLFCIMRNLCQADTSLFRPATTVRASKAQDFYLGKRPNLNLQMIFFTRHFKPN